MQRSNGLVCLGCCLVHEPLRLPNKTSQPLVVLFAFDHPLLSFNDRPLQSTSLATSLSVWTSTVMSIITQRSSEMSMATSPQSRIADVIAPFQDSEEEPPFTPKELLVMTLLVEGRPLTERAIIHRVFDHFKYYRQQAYETFFEPDGFYYSKSRRAAADYRRQFQEVLKQAELPVEIIRNQGASREEQYFISAKNCEQMLSGVLHPQGTGDQQPFRFFDLPAELRNTIYELTFQYPKSGLFLSKERKYAYVQTRSIAEDTKVGHDFQRLTYDGLKEYFRTAPIKDILSPLLVSRQFYQEASPVFYSINHFYFLDSEVMNHVLKSISGGCRSHIRHVSFIYPAWTYYEKWVAESLAFLATCTSLRKLEIYFDEAAWKEQGSTRTGKQVKKYDSLKNVVGFGGLGRLRGLEEVIFHGCPELEKMLKSKMLQPKPKPDVGMGTKRKTGGDEGDAKTGTKRKKSKSG